MPRQLPVFCAVFSGALVIFAYLLRTHSILPSTRPAIQVESINAVSEKEHSVFSAVGMVGEIFLFAGKFAPRGSIFCEGQIVQTRDYPSVSSLLGSTYGGDARSTFGLPDLRGRVPIHAANIGLYGLELGQKYGKETIGTGTVITVAGSERTGNLSAFLNSGDNRQPTLGLHYCIRTEGVFPHRPGTGSAQNWTRFFPGAILSFGLNYAPNGWFLCNGQSLSVSQYPNLFNTIGYTYGGSGNSFKLPDLRGRAPVGAGTGNNLSTRTIGQYIGATTVGTASKVAGAGRTNNQQVIRGNADNIQPSLNVNYCITPEGGNPSYNEPYYGQIILFAGATIPNGWKVCDGQLLSIFTNQALFSIIGATYGGDGLTTFALPDMRGRIPVHAGTGIGLSTISLGQKVGQETLPTTTVAGEGRTGNQTILSGTANNMQPSLVLNYIIAVEGCYPPRS